ncbi:hypothetical protein C8Q76DRAFT_591603, partial [Earliella scabrosa]
MNLSIHVYALIGFACEAVCWGINSVLFLISVALTLYRLQQSHALRVPQLPMIGLTCALFLCCTAHFALEFNHFYIVLGTTGVDGFANETKPMLGADILLSVCDLLGNLILIYRCWIIWGRNYWIVGLPTLTAIAGFSCVAGVAHLVITKDPTSPLPPPAIIPLGLATYSLPLATNVITTGLIVGKLRWMLHSTVLVGGRSTGIFQRGYGAVQRAAGIFIESGVLYLITQLILVVLFSIDHPANLIVSEIAVQVYGIASTLIVMRITLGIAHDSAVQRTPNV